MNNPSSHFQRACAGAGMSGLPSWRNKRVGFHCAAIFYQTLFESVERRATLIQRNSDRCAGTLDDNHSGCTKSFFKFFVRDGHRNRVSFCSHVGLHTTTPQMDDAVAEAKQSIDLFLLHLK